VSTYKTTLGAPLTDDEYNEMQKALLDAKMYLTMVQIGLDPVALLNVATGIIDHGFKLRDAIQRGFNEANRRSATKLVGGARHLKVVSKAPVARSSTQVDIDDILRGIKDDIHNLLKGSPK
jgi:hypothetical protein